MILENLVITVQILTVAEHLKCFYSKKWKCIGKINAITLHKEM